jgi:hypothetical protein
MHVHNRILFFRFSMEAETTPCPLPSGDKLLKSADCVKSQIYKNRREKSEVPKGKTGTRISSSSFLPEGNITPLKNSGNALVGAGARPFFKEREGRFE